MIAQNTQDAADWDEMYKLTGEDVFKAQIDKSLIDINLFSCTSSSKKATVRLSVCEN